MRYLLFLLASFLFLACADDEFNSTPELNFIAISPSTVQANQDSVVITIAYKDGDGDLGENAEAVKNLFVQDSRNQVNYEYRVKELAPRGSNIAIQGELEVLINNTSIVNGGNSEAVSYSIWMFDRAGNRSNTITTSSITVIP